MKRTTIATLVRVRDRMSRDGHPAAPIGELRLADGRTLDDLGYLFIVTYGRSGSTLLQGLLNSTPGFLIRGENNAALYDLYRYHATLAGESAQIRYSRLKEVDSRSPYFGIDRYAAEQAIADIRSLVVRTLLQPEPDTTVTGFKEIRWWQQDWEGYLDFLQSVFPGARFVINTRDLDAVAQSKWWAEYEDPQSALAERAERLDAIAARLGEAAYRVHYDDYVADPESLRGLYGWLGASFDRSRIDEVLGMQHSY